MKRVLLLALILLLVVAPVRAQETGEASVTDLFTAVGGLVGAFLVGVAAGGSGALVILRAIISRIKDDEPTKLAIEKLAMSLPPGTLKDIREVIREAREVVLLADELTDGQFPETNRKFQQDSD